jgi:cytochrome P450
MSASVQAAKVNEAAYSLFQLLKPEVIADPYPLYRKLREYEPVHWDPFLHSWVVTSYAECVTALTKYKAARTPTPEHLEAMGLGVLAPHAGMMLKQILFMDGPAHAHLRAMCMVAFTPRRVELMRDVTRESANRLIDEVAAKGKIDLVQDFSGMYPALVLAKLMGLPPEDSEQLKHWSYDVSELLGNFEHNPDRVKTLVKSLEEIRAYLTAKLTDRRHELSEGVISALSEAEVDGVRLSVDDIVANALLIYAGGLEEPSNLISCGILTLLQRPDKLEQLRDHPEIAPQAVEELVRFEAPTQQTGRLAPEDTVLGGKSIRKGDMVTIVVAAANRDPLRFHDPDILDLTRADNRHLSFGWAAHYCIGAPFTRLMGQVAFGTLLRRLPELSLAAQKPQWRSMASLRGLASLPLEFDSQAAMTLQGKG